MHRPPASPRRTLAHGRALCAAGVALLFLLTPAGRLRAQASASGIIASSVRTREGAPLAGATVSARFADGTFERQGITDRDGMVQLGALPPGTYQVSVRRLGYRPVVTGGVVVTASTVSRVQFALESSAQALAPVVVRRPTEPPGRETEVASTRVDAQQIADLPVGLDLNRLVALTPGARPDQMWGGAGLDANAYRLDGVAINHPGLGGPILQPSVHWIQEIDIRGLGSGADQGGFQGGMVDVVTRSGTNTRVNHAAVHYEDGRLNASNLSGADIVPELAGRQEASADFAGPIVKNRLFYFVAGQWVQARQRTLDHLGSARFSPVQGTSQSGSVFTKLTWTPGVHDLATLAVALSDSAMDHAGLTGRETADATSRVRSPSVVLDGSWQRTLGASTIIEARAVGFTASTSQDPYRSPSIPGISTYQLATAESFQNAAFVVRQRPTSAGFTLTVDRFAQVLGAHHFRVGAEQVSGGWRDDRTRTAGMTWRPRNSTIDGSASTFDPTDALTWQAWTPTGWGGETHVHARIRNGAAFVQDDYTLGRLGLHPGLRYGWWSGLIDPAAGGASIRAVRASGLDPRVGVTVDLGSATRASSFTVHWGQYHQDLFSEMFDRVAGANAYSNYEIWEYGGARFANPATVVTRAQRDSLAALGKFRQIELDELDQSGVVRNYRQPYVDQLVVGWQGDVVAGVHLSAAYVRRDNRNIVALVDRNAASNYVVADSVAMFDVRGRWVADYARADDVLVIPHVYIPKNAIAAALAAGLSVPRSLQAGGDLTWNPQYEITNPVGAQRHFRQYLLTADVQRPAWQLAGSVAWSTLRGNFSTVSGYDPASTTGWDRLVGRGPGPWVRPNEAINGYGDLDNASRVEYKLRVSGTLGRGFRGGAVLSVVSGDHLTPVFTLQPYVYQYFAHAGRIANGRTGPAPDTLPAMLFLPLAGQRINLAPVGSYHYASHATLDLHLERAVRVAGVAWTLQADVFNALGSRAVTLINTSVDASTNPNSPTQFGTPLGRVAPRTLRLGSSAAW